jgi:mitochondrial fission protein ELM1
MKEPAAETPDDGPATTGTALWVISDGTEGMRLQAIGLAEAMKRQRPELVISEFQADPHWLIRMLPRLGHHASFLPLYADAPDIAAAQKQPVRGRHGDLLITCGRRMAGLGLALRARARADGTRTQLVHLQDPRLPPALFDALVVPEHDRARGRNVITTTGSLNRLTRKSIQQSMMDLPTKWLVRDTVPCVVVMLGGDNRRYRISPEMAAAMAARLRAFAQSEPMRLVLIPSRRTSAALTETLGAQLGETDIHIVNPHEANPYPGILGVADAIIVTSDSVNMASEAAITGKPVLIAGWNAAAGVMTDRVAAVAAANVGERGRIAAFHRHMIAAGHTAPLAAELPRTPFTALDEMDAVCKRVFSVLGR